MPICKMTDMEGMPRSCLECSVGCNVHLEWLEKTTANTDEEWEDMKRYVADKRHETCPLFARPSRDEAYKILCTAFPNNWGAITSELLDKLGYGEGKYD